MSVCCSFFFSCIIYMMLMCGGCNGCNAEASDALYCVRSVLSVPPPTKKIHLLTSDPPLLHTHTHMSAPSNPTTAPSQL